MRILLHLCCGPCTIYPLARLRGQGHEVTGLFFNPNIHPFQEFRRRIDAVRQLSELVDFPVEIDREYGLTEYLRRVVFHEAERCPICYEMRLARTVQVAVAGGFEGFTTTLLYSKYQNHRLLIERCEQLAAENQIRFVYEDFRQGWQEGIDESIRLGLYRQPYCGCIYSEQERYDKRLRKRRKAASQTTA
ncbi:epoxyqueuosine reductase QueH [Desulfobulbus propionicus]|jgi:predicted adenine nucleotide alpha hydrolase (AANH) superfamily ATPase